VAASLPSRTVKDLCVCVSFVVQNQGLCVDGQAHNFMPVNARNEAIDRGAGLTAKFFGFGGGAKAKSKHDHGDRVLIFCTKCGKPPPSLLQAY
jgi:hypothetical protein